MKITFIRHAKVRFEWPAVCDSGTFDRCCAEYDAAPVEQGLAIACGAGIVYTSALRRTADTVQHQLGNRPVVQTPALNEIPLVSFMDSHMPLPTLAWMLMGRLQWYCNWPRESRQPESRQQSHKRIDDFLDDLQRKGEDCVLVGHGMYFVQLLSALKRRGAVGNMKKRINNSEAREFFL